MDPLVPKTFKAVTSKLTLKIGVKFTTKVYTKTLKLKLWG